MELAARVTVGATTERERAIRLFYAVRDGIRYDPYTISTDPENYRASAIAMASSSWCVPKAVLLCAAARAAGIEARLGFADVRNHLQSDKLRERMGTDLFVYHGYVGLHLDDRWVKVTPAFNVELCQRFGVRPLEFDGIHDALFHSSSVDGRLHMEYVRDRGFYDDLPFDKIMAKFQSTYPKLVGGFAGPDRMFSA